MTLIPRSRKAQLTMLIWASALYVGSAAAVINTIGPGTSKVILVVVMLAAPVVPLFIWLNASLYNFIPKLVLQPRQASQAVRAFFVRYGPGLKQTWRGLAACVFLFGALVNLLLFSFQG